MTDQNEYEPESGDPYYTNDVGTKFWQKPEFNDIIKQCGLADTQVLLSETVEGNEMHWSYCIVNNTGDLLLFSKSKQTIYNMFKVTLETLQKKGSTE